MDLSLLLIFSLGVIGVLLNIALIFIPTQSYVKAKYLFIVFIFIQSLNIFYAYFVLSEEYLHYPNIINYNHILQALTPAVIYIFSIYMIRPQSKVKGAWSILIIPAILVFALLFPFYTQPVESKIIFIEQLLSNQVKMAAIPVFIVKMISGITFIILALIELKKHEHNIFQFYTNIDNITHRWLRNALFFFLIIWLIAVIVGRSYGNIMSIKILALSVGLINYYLFINYIVHIIPLKKEIKKVVLSEDDDQSYSTDLNVLKEALLNDLAEKKPYLNPNCDLSCIAKEVDLKPYIVSKIINQTLNTNFYNFINELRVKEAAQMLLNTEMGYLTIEAIAQNSGFNSKATFYKAFRNVYNCTPKAYKKMNLEG